MNPTPASPPASPAPGSPELGTTERDRRQAIDQALASTSIEGHRPSPEFLQDLYAAAAGQLGVDALLARARARALVPAPSEPGADSGTGAGQGAGAGHGQ